MRYGVSIGRRQPMHRVHVDCIREIVDAGLKPIIMVGSVNNACSPFYDPIRNPLNFEQQKEQIRIALPFVDNPEIVPLPDVGNLQLWCESVVALLGNRVSESLIHYRAKRLDKVVGAIEPLSASEKIFAELGLKSWRTENKNPADDTLHGNILRYLPIDDPQFQCDLAAPEYIRELVLQARVEHPNAKNWDVPIMRDISLWRLWKETGKLA